jgi:hypothetical protein
MKIDLRRKIQPTPELQYAVDQRKKVVNKILSDIKRHPELKQKIIPIKRLNG